MSGPKRTSYSIARELYQLRKQEQSIRRKNQIDEITKELEHCTKQIQKLMNNHGNNVHYISDRVESWMNDVNQALSGDLREAWRSLKGIKIYLDSQEERLNKKDQRMKQQKLSAEKQYQKAKHHEQEKQKNIIKAQDEIEQMKDRISELKHEFGDKISQIMKQPNKWIEESAIELGTNPTSVSNSMKGVRNYLDSKENEIKVIRTKMIQEEKTNRIVESIKSIETDYADLMNDGIKQRIDLFSKSIQMNPDNENTLKQIESFKQTLQKQMEDYENKRADQKHVADTFADALGSSAKEDGSGGVVIDGNIDGVPITVRLNNSNNQINMDTPSDGSCRQGLDALQIKLENANISLGDIKIMKTGQTIKNKRSIQTKRRLNA
jgi:hypothetical protein